MPMEQRALETLEYKLKKRGFKQEDVYHHECPSCKEQAVRVYAIGGKLGGRDIRVCLACSKTTSFRAGAGMEGRVEDTAFDIDDFLK
ncbi:MAG TPA: hypothetical protein VL326_24850 [Kofleriaceae bacterium]|jgi:ribosomal protein L37AE/L43A|nr:hypothetical protein [Kofleriaceae bacterium]